MSSTNTGCRLLICGDRNWTNREFILDKLRNLPLQVEVVIEGECRGADIEGRWAAEQLGIPVMPFPADWSKHGKAAGPIRNQQMLDEGKPTLVWAFHNDIEHSRGTANMCGRALAIGIPVEVFHE